MNHQPLLDDTAHPAAAPLILVDTTSTPNTATTATTPTRETGSNFYPRIHTTTTNSNNVLNSTGTPVYSNNHQAPVYSSFNNNNNNYNGTVAPTPVYNPNYPPTSYRSTSSSIAAPSYSPQYNKTPAPIYNTGTNPVKNNVARTNPMMNHSSFHNVSLPKVINSVKPNFNTTVSPIQMYSPPKSIPTTYVPTTTPVYRNNNAINQNNINIYNKNNNNNNRMPQTTPVYAPPATPSNFRATANTVMKRSRGRPPKNQRQPPPVVPGKTRPTLKRKRGRPPKNPTPSLTTTSPTVTRRTRRSTTEVTSSTTPSTPSVAVGRKRRNAHLLKKHTSITDAVKVEQPFFFQDEQGDGAYISCTVNNKRRYYGILLDQSSIKAASSIYFQQEAESLQLNRHMQQKYENSGDSTDKPAISAAITTDNRSVQKFEYIPPKTPKEDPGYRVLVATYANVEAASEAHPELKEKIEQACLSGGDFVKKYFYQYVPVTPSILHTNNEDTAKNTLDIHTSLSWMDVFQYAQLPPWFPLTNIVDPNRTQSKICNLLQLSKRANKHGELQYKPTTNGGTVINRQFYKIAIVGGGISGLACAAELLRLSKIKNLQIQVILLEARGRLGGRIHSYKQDGTVLELGASWIHGTSGNPLVPLVKEDNKMVQVKEEVPLLQREAKPVPTKLDERMAQQLDDDLDHGAQHCWEIAELEPLPTTQPSDHNVTRWHASTEENKDDIPMYRWSNDLSVEQSLPKRKFTPDEKLLWMWNVKNVEYALGANLSDLSTKYWASEDEHALEGPHVLLTQGYSKLVESLLEKCRSYGTDSFQMHTNTSVTQIQYNNPAANITSDSKYISKSNVCRVVTNNNDHPEHNVDFVVCTLPLGVLKQSQITASQNSTSTPNVAMSDNSNNDRITIASVSNNDNNDENHDAAKTNLGVEPDKIVSQSSETMQANDKSLFDKENKLNRNHVVFDPPLPQWKQDAIDMVGFGLLNKIYITFETAFWRKLPVIENADAFGNVSGVQPQYYMFYDIGKLMHPKKNTVIINNDQPSGNEEAEKATTSEKKSFEEAIAVDDTDKDREKRVVENTTNSNAEEMKKPDIHETTETQDQSGHNSSDENTLRELETNIKNVKDEAVVDDILDTSNKNNSIELLTGMEKNNENDQNLNTKNLEPNSHVSNDNDDNVNEERDNQTNREKRSQHPVEHEVKEAPAILCTLISGKEAKRMEGFKDEELQKQVLEVLRAIFGDLNVPEPTKIVVTRWGKDEYACGCYTFLPPNATDEDYGLLQKSIHGNHNNSYPVLNNTNSETNRLFFAGEHTTSLYPSMVHGAFLSGVRAAIEIMDSTRKPDMNTNHDVDVSIPVTVHRSKYPEKPLKCQLCHKIGSRKSEGALAAFQRGQRQVLVHINCAQFSPEVERLDDTWRHVLKAVKRSKSVQCQKCQNYGATIGCNATKCYASFHYSCCEENWSFERDGKRYFCPIHRHLAKEEEPINTASNAPQTKKNTILSVTKNNDNKISASKVIDLSTNDCLLDIKLYEKMNPKAPLKCMLCPSSQHDDERRAGTLLASFNSQNETALAHLNCIKSLDITVLNGSLEMGKGLFRNLIQKIQDCRSNKKCTKCHQMGASVTCSQCHQSFHLLCTSASYHYPQHLTCDKHTTITSSQQSTTIHHALIPVLVTSSHETSSPNLGLSSPTDISHVEKNVNKIQKGDHREQERSESSEDSFMEDSDDPSSDMIEEDNDDEDDNKDGLDSDFTFEEEEENPLDEDEILDEIFL